VQGELDAPHILDQISLPARGATPEEILLRPRQLESGCAYGFSMGITYTLRIHLQQHRHPALRAMRMRVLREVL